MTGISSSCGACKFLRRRCTNECIFAPYFCYEQAASHFAAVHRIFGASNVSKLLSHLPVHSRNDAAITISYEALSRIQDPVYGCVAYIYALQQQVASLEEEIEILGNQMANIGVNIAAYEISNPYFAAQSEIGSNCSNQQSLPILYPEASGSCSHTELQTVDEISEGFLNSSNFERLVEELNMDYFLLEELSQDYHYMHS